MKQKQSPVLSSFSMSRASPSLCFFCLSRLESERGSYIFFVFFCFWFRSFFWFIAGTGFLLMLALSLILSLSLLDRKSGCCFSRIVYYYGLVVYLVRSLPEVMFGKLKTENRGKETRVTVSRSGSSKIAKKNGARPSDFLRFSDGIDRETRIGFQRHH